MIILIEMDAAGGVAAKPGSGMEKKTMIRQLIRENLDGKPIGKGCIS